MGTHSEIFPSLEDESKRKDNRKGWESPELLTEKSFCIPAASSAGHGCGNVEESDLIALHEADKWLGQSFQIRLSIYR